MRKKYDYKIITATMTEPMYTEFNAICKQLGDSRTSVLRSLIRNFIREQRLVSQEKLEYTK